MHLDMSRGAIPHVPALFCELARIEARHDAVRDAYAPKEPGSAAPWEDLAPRDGLMGAAEWAWIAARSRLAGTQDCNARDCVRLLGAGAEPILYAAYAENYCSVRALLALRGPAGEMWRDYFLGTP